MAQLNDAIRTVEMKDEIIQSERAQKQRHRSDAQVQRSSLKQLLRMTHGSRRGDVSHLPSHSEEMVLTASPRPVSERSRVVAPNDARASPSAFSTDHGKEEEDV